MRIRMKTTMAGPDGVVPAGTIIERERGVAYGLIEGGFAEQLDPEPPPAPAAETVEEATLFGQEDATGTGQRRRRKRLES